MNTQIALGSKVKDTLSGFAGVAIGRAEYLYSTPAILISAPSLNSEGKALEEWFNESRIEVIA